MNPTKSLILLVEDNPLNRQLVRDILIYRGHEVLEAATVSEAKLKLEQAKPDLVLLDIQIPGGGGEVLFKQIRERPELADVPVIAITAFAMPSDVARFRRLGFDAYLSKPIDTRQFASQVQALIKR
jgi:CheY-like chemotaxis protein